MTPGDRAAGNGRNVLAIVSTSGDGQRLAALRGLSPDSAQEFVVIGDESLDALQELVYNTDVDQILLSRLKVLGDDVLSQEVMLSGWRAKGVEVFVEQAEETEERQHARAALDEIDDYGKIPWVP